MNLSENMSKLVYASVLCSTFAFASQVSAQSDQDRARAHFTAGSEQVEAGHHAQAHAEFESGYTLSARPLFLFNMAECSFLAGNSSRARTEYERYLQEDSDGSRVAAARARLDEIGPAPRDASPNEAGPNEAGPNELGPNEAGPIEARPVDLTVSAPEAAAPDPILATPPQSSADRSPRWYRNWKVWTVVSAIVVAGAATAIGVSAARSDGASCSNDCFTVDLTR